MQAIRAAACRTLGWIGGGGALSRTPASFNNSIASLRPNLAASPLQNVFGWGPMGIGQVREMRHRQMRGNLGRSPKKRWALLRSLVTELVKHERIITTLARAKELRKIGDMVVTMGKQGTLFARRRATAVLRTDETLHKLFAVLTPRYKDRIGGYTRILRHRENRKGDNAPMAFVEYIDRPGELRDPKPAVKRLPYSKMLARAQYKQDAELVEYYTKLQTEVVAATEKKVQRLQLFQMRTGKRTRPSMEGMTELPEEGGEGGAAQALSR